jgi:IS5 family transposase
MTQISRFLGQVVPVAQRVTSDCALVSLHCLRIYPDTSHRMKIDLLKEMPQITEETGLNTADLASSTLCKAFE